MNKYVGYFLIMICMFLIIVLCIELGIKIEKDINTVRCNYENQIEIDKP